jgi:hypothetical protein
VENIFGRINLQRAASQKCTARAFKHFSSCNCARISLLQKPGRQRGARQGTVA